MRRVLIFHISEFGGHKSASQNIKEALELVDPTITVRNINGFGYLYPKTEKIVGVLYTTLIRRVPILWGKVYDRKILVKAISPAHRIVNKYAFIRLRILINEFKPDVIIATQAFPCGIVSQYKKDHNISIPLIAVVTDYHPHCFWLSPGIDAYIVACNEAKETLQKEGIASEKINVLGIPISLRFMESYTKYSVARKYNFDDTLPSLLVMGGGLGFGPIKDIVLELQKIDIPLQIIVVCGRNKKLRAWFKNRVGLFRKPLHYFGYIDFVNELMDFSDIIITKAGGISISEALAKNLAIIVVNAIPGQEELNVKYLLEHEAILSAETVSEVAFLVQGLLSHKSELLSLKERARANSINDSALKIARFINNFTE